MTHSLFLLVANPRQIHCRSAPKSTALQVAAARFSPILHTLPTLYNLQPPLIKMACIASSITNVVALKATKVQVSHAAAAPLPLFFPPPTPAIIFSFGRIGRSKLPRGGRTACASPTGLNIARVLNGRLSSPRCAAFLVSSRPRGFSRMTLPSTNPQSYPRFQKTCVLTPPLLPSRSSHRPSLCPA